MGFLEIAEGSAVLGDNDGILVKTEEPYFESAREMMRELNLELARELYR
jgi:beta-phosphoglucomutase-like phosphatase (HAD superfamily)